MIFVERADVIVHFERGVAPRRGDQHGECVLQRSAGLDQQFERGVEFGRVRPALFGDGVELLKVATKELAVHLWLACCHPVAVAAHGVDLAVVGDHVERVREVPRAHRVGGEAGVDECECRFDVAVGKVGVVRSDLCCSEQTLVDDRLRRDADDRKRVLHNACLHGLLDPTADHVELALEGVLFAVAALDDQLANNGRRRACDRPDRSVIDGHVAPADGAVALFGDDAHGDLFAAEAQRRVLG